jgi:hypothetical protein
VSIINTNRHQGHGARQVTGSQWNSRGLAHMPPVKLIVDKSHQRDLSPIERRLLMLQESNARGRVLIRGLIETIGQMNDRLRSVESQLIRRGR